MNDQDFNPKEWFAGAEAPKGLSTDEAWGKLQTRVNLTEAKVVRMKRGRGVWWGAAAVVAAVALGALFFLPGSEEISVAAGTDGKQLDLPDGSHVLLEPYASLTYDEANWSDNRELTLKGGAFFSVEKGSTFTVNTDNGDVQVLGTSFDVESEGGVFEVCCYEGKVAVTHGEDRVELTSGKMTAMNGEGLKSPSGFQVYRDHDGDFHFEEVTLAEMFDALAQAYEVKFKCSFANEMTISQDVALGTPIHEVLDALCLVKGLTYEMQKDVIVLMKK